MRAIAREQAEALYKQAVQGLFGLIERRIEWRRANAHLLALEAERMVVLLTSAPERIPFRKLKIRFWRWKQRKHGARAWAADRAVAMACRICPEGGGTYA